MKEEPLKPSKKLDNQILAIVKSIYADKYVRKASIARIVFDKVNKIARKGEKRSLRDKL